MLTRAEIESAFIKACVTEIQALKPGNVHVFAPGHGMDAAEFIVSAEAAAPHIANPALGLGKRIEAAVRATWGAVGKNTNLGIILLCAPLAMAAERSATLDDLRNAAAEIVRASSVKDAAAAFRAIALANPGGLGEREHDVRHSPAITLYEAMRLAADRDFIARQYANGFAEMFGAAAPALNDGLSRFGDVRWAASFAYLKLLSCLPDSHIQRKFGRETAMTITAEAAAAAATLTQTSDPQTCISPLMEFDASLKARGLNPGTTADMTVAALFAAGLTNKAESRA